MRKYSAFDILGPIMIGPSSSHTAGAARLGKIARTIAGEDIISVKFLLHGSFAMTYKGHGTDKALAAGIIGMDPWDERLKSSLEIALNMGIKLEFIKADLGEVHPNTVKFIITKSSGDQVEIIGSSIGGGNIIITEVDGDALEFTGTYPTLIINQNDVPGVINNVTAILYKEKINIAFMKVYRNNKGRDASMLIEVDSMIFDNIIKQIAHLPDVNTVKFINPVRA
jgi:L-serine dehydratase